MGEPEVGQAAVGSWSLVWKQLPGHGAGSGLGEYKKYPQILSLEFRSIRSPWLVARRLYSSLPESTFGNAGITLEVI